MKNYMKKVVPVALAMMMGANVMATTNDLEITYNGEVMELIEGPKVINQSVMLPLRALSESLGYVVEWKKSEGIIEIKDGSDIVTLFIGQKNASINGKETILEVPPQLINGTTYIPLRFVSEAMNIEVEWNSALRKVELEGKYILDKENKKLIMKTASGKQVLGPVFLSSSEMASAPSLAVKKTSSGSEFITVYQYEEGALTSSASTIYYIKSGKVIDKIIPTDTSVMSYEDAIVEKDRVAFSSNGSIRVYDDTTGNCIKELNVDSFVFSHISEQYLVGVIGNKTCIIDLITDKKTNIIDGITNAQDKKSVAMEDLVYSKDAIEVVWLQEDAIVFKYYSEVEGKEKTITYKVGEGIIAK